MDPDRFFGHHIDPLTLAGRALALLLALLLTGIIGFERECRGQAAGLRTHILVGIGAALITITSIEISSGFRGGKGDPAHLAAQIVSGIGFLGAGAILRDGTTVHGLTTAASIWVAAAIGIAVGTSPRMGEVAVIGTVVVMGTLIALNWLEDALHLKQHFRMLEVEVKEADHAPARLIALLAELNIVVLGVTSQTGSPSDAEPTRKMQIRVNLPRTFQRDRFNSLLMEDPSIISFNLD